VVGVLHLPHRGPGAAVDLATQRHVAEQASVGIGRGQVAVQERFGGGGAVAGGRALHLGDVAVAGVGGDGHRHAVGIGVALEYAALGGLPRGAEAAEDDLVSLAVDQRVGVVAAVVGQLGGIGERRLVDAALKGEVGSGGAVGDDDEGVGGRAVGSDQLWRVGIDPAVAVDAVGVAGPVAPRTCLRPGEAETGRVQVGLRDGDDAVGVAHGIGAGRRWLRRGLVGRRLRHATG